MNRLHETGFGSLWSKQQQAQRECDRCGSTELSYETKHYAKCTKCGRLMPKRRKSSKETKTVPLIEAKEEREIPVTLGNRMTGTIRGRRYISHRNKEHFVKKYTGFAITTEIFQYLLVENVKEIAIIYTKVDNTQEVYYSDVKDWTNYAIKDRLGGFEEQMFLDKKYMKRVGWATKK